MEGYIYLLRNHIAKENNVLFRMAGNVLSGDEQQELLKEFAKVETSGDGDGVLSGFLHAIDDLKAIYERN